jgi:hypothetical protein
MFCQFHGVQIRIRNANAETDMVKADQCGPSMALGIGLLVPLLS